MLQRLEATQRDVSSHLSMKFKTIQQVGKGETPTGLAQCELGLISVSCLMDQRLKNINKPSCE